MFIDLGAADGNTFQHFLKNGYGNVSACPSGGQWEAILIEANPIFSRSLMQLQQIYSGAVRSLIGAAYMCEGTTSFYLDTVDVEQNYWGSSMSPNARDVQRSGKKQITVPLTNIARLIVESTIPEDYVLVKMDIEGSEHDIVPCLVQSSAAKLIDALYVEKHPQEWSTSDGDRGTLQSALSILQQSGTTVPEYDSPS
jgi:FkbM family methyltransferase